MCWCLSLTEGDDQGVENRIPAEEVVRPVRTNLVGEVQIDESQIIILDNKPNLVRVYIYSPIIRNAAHIRTLIEPNIQAEILSDRSMKKRRVCTTIKKGVCLGLETTVEQRYGNQWIVFN